MSSPEVNQKNITLNVKICSNYPIINEQSEIANTQIISQFKGSVKMYDINPNNPDAFLQDDEKYTHNI